MERRKQGIAAGAALTLLAAWAGAGAASVTDGAPGTNDLLLPADAVVDGAGFGEWTARWWQWADAQPIPPYLDPDGRICDIGQEGPVWYLAGTDGSFSAERQCVVPEGKHLLIPVINMVYMSPNGPDGKPRLPCDAMQTLAGVNNDRLASAVATIDGVPVDDVKRYRVRSTGCFVLDDGRTAAADGYWLFLKPLPRGRHVIAVGANYDAGQGGGDGQMVQSFEYVIHVGEQTTLTLQSPEPRAVDTRQALGTFPDHGDRSIDKQPLGSSAVDRTAPRERIPRPRATVPAGEAERG